MRIKSLDTLEELNEAMRVNNLAWKDAYRDILPEELLNRIPKEPPDDVVAERFETIGEGDESFLIAVDEERAVRGYIYVRWGDETKGFVGDAEAGLKEIYVHPDSWGEGIGTELLDDALEALPSAVEAIRLEMLAGNERGSEFYLSRGFEIVGQSEYEFDGETFPTEIYVRSL